MLQVRSPAGLVLRELDIFIKYQPVKGKLPRFCLTEVLLLHVIKPLPFTDFNKEGILYSSLNVLIVVIIVFTNSKPP